MLPIQDLLNKIRWDPEFGKGDFRLGYFDRVEQRIITVPLKDIHFEPDNHFAFEVYDDEGTLHHIPLHRVRIVYKDDQIIWQRP